MDVHGLMTSLRPATAADVARLVAWHADPDVARYRDDGGRGPGPDAARAMTRHLLEERGRTRVTVDPYAWNDRAVRAWRRAGFVEVGRRPPDDEHTAEWIEMEFRG